MGPLQNMVLFKLNQFNQLHPNATQSDFVENIQKIVRTKRDDAELIRPKRAIFSGIMLVITAIASGFAAASTAATREYLENQTTTPAPVISTTTTALNAFDNPRSRRSSETESDDISLEIALDFNDIIDRFISKNGKDTDIDEIRVNVLSAILLSQLTTEDKDNLNALIQQKLEATPDNRDKRAIVAAISIFVATFVPAILSLITELPMQVVANNKQRKAQELQNESMALLLERLHILAEDQRTTSQQILRLTNAFINSGMSRPVASRSANTIVSANFDLDKPEVKQTLAQIKSKANLKTLYNERRLDKMRADRDKRSADHQTELLPKLHASKGHSDLLEIRNAILQQQLESEKARLNNTQQIANHIDKLRTVNRENANATNMVMIICIITLVLLMIILVGIFFFVYLCMKRPAMPII